MSTEMNEFSHPDSIWTWKSNSRSRKASVWIPYFEGVEKVKGTTYKLRFNGGPVDIDLKKVDCLLIYGAAGSFPVDFLEALNTYSITLLIHRRNIPTPMVFHPLNTKDQADVLTKQIVCRQDARRRVYVAKTLIAARLHSMAWLAPIAAVRFSQIRACRTLQKVRQIEAEQTRNYWERFYWQAGIQDVARRSVHPINAALDAGSFFMFGVLLRWVLFHRMSPAHGFMHEPTDYQSLVFDLMEPYRVIFERAVLEAWLADPAADTLTVRSLSLLKGSLGNDAFVGAARATASRKSLLHAVVLALRAYLLGEMPRLVIPMEGGSLTGRPPKLSYSVPGARTALRGRKRKADSVADASKSNEEKEAAAF
jgi:CRISPR/Cas system-associated endonuclease Cas1